MNTKTGQSLLASFSDELSGLIMIAAESVYSVDARRKFPASGFAIGEDLILTADHVVEREDNLRVGNGGDTFTASLVGRDPHHDLALLKVSGVKLRALDPAMDPPKIGSLAVALGRPGRSIQASLGMLASSGEWPSRRRSGAVQAILRAEVFAYPGFSGGPLIDAQGAVLGMNTSAVAMGGLVTLSMPFLGGLLEQLKSHGHVRQGYLGVRFQVVELGSAQVKSLGRDQKTALLVSGVESDSPAARGNIQVGDILVGLGGEEVSGIESLQALLSSDLIGRKTKVELLRGSTPTTVEVEVGER